ncbi:MAG: nickel pincer cofactor biosynthesis protein LarC [Planctomycetes bacterium]|nr:nickel pincer cofactor biosynthesis protein LarC [Planctomycetota bacterium]
MRIAYLDCASGISGDMTLGALVDAGADLAAIQAGIDSLGLPGCRLVSREVKKLGFRATQISVEHEPELTHRHLHHITAMIEGSVLAPLQQKLAKRIFQKLAEAEAKVHGTTVEKVHFHEVGAVDSIADIVGSAIGFDLLGIERIVCSPVPTGRGFVEIAHGLCSIPAPATGELLRDVPLAARDVEGELTTPTGAAIVAALAVEFGPLPAMTVERIGYGAGQKDFEHPNLLRILVGEAALSAESLWTGRTDALDLHPRIESILLLETNLDNITGECLGHAIDCLWAAGALDVSITAIQMKKGRPGVLLSVQCDPSHADALEVIVFSETTTLGVRRVPVMRKVLARQQQEVQTPWGDIRGKVAYLPNGVERFSPEYEDCRRIAMEHGVRLAEVISTTTEAFCIAAKRCQEPM